MFNELTIAYLFLGGTGGGAAVVLGLLEFANRGRYGHPRLGGAMLPQARPSRRLNGPLRLVAPHELLAYGWIATLVTLGTACLCLLCDVGRPERVWSLLISPVATPISVGAWSLFATVACVATLALLAVKIRRAVSRRVVALLTALTMVSGLVTVGYTGVLLQAFASVLAYQTPLVTVLFVLSSLSCGTGLVCGCAAFVESRQSMAKVLGALLTADRVIIVLEVVAVAAYLWWLSAPPGCGPAFAALINGPLSSSFWVCFLLLGLVLPFAMEMVGKVADYRQLMLWIGFFLLFGGCTLRWWMTGLADFDVTQMPETLFGLSQNSIME